MSSPFLKPSKSATSNDLFSARGCCRPCGFTNRFFVCVNNNGFFIDTMIKSWENQGWDCHVSVPMIKWSTLSCQTFLKTQLIRLNGGNTKPNSCPMGEALHLSLCSWDLVFRLYIKEVDDRSLMQKDLSLVFLYAELFFEILEHGVSSRTCCFMLKLVRRYLAVIVICFWIWYSQIDLLMSSKCCRYPPSLIQKKVQFCCLFGGEWKYYFLFLES